MADLQNVQKGPEAWHNPLAPTPINSNKLFIAQQKKNAAPFPQPSLSMCAARAGSLLLAPLGSQLYVQGKVRAAIITHTIPQLLAC